MPQVIDTNVLIVANEMHEGVSPECVIACVEALDRVRTHGRVVVDDGYEILSEYGRKTAPNTGNRVGDAFLKWLYQNVGNPERVERVSIEKHARKGYVQFPDDEELSEFDHSDRKFVAVAAVHQNQPPILQGTDSKWVEWAERLSAHGIKVRFLCPGDVKKFIKRKRAGGA